MIDDIDGTLKPWCAQDKLYVSLCFCGFLSDLSVLVVAFACFCHCGHSCSQGSLAMPLLEATRGARIVAVSGWEMQLGHGQSTWHFERE